MDAVAPQTRMLHVLVRNFSAAMRILLPVVTLRKSSPSTDSFHLRSGILTPNPNIREDCAAGTCYEGACAGDSVYTTTGQCGRQHGYRLCAGVWGDCCNADGKCGTGESFCAFGVCQLGNCTIPPTIPSLPSWLNGNTTDGTCGGTNFFTCNVVYGNCCNKNGMCGTLPSDCGAGW